ncbi:antibiotic biosynthesis monooxygenase family protein [Roseospira visakhapatnamensis]|uniref:Heme-degrading monooxygenase HmoA n=1 Tax=Roseospira visakhapatnamensis TaxID=390880 RepID=A0A7W6WAH8_9PROT|nr:hypothetical protein [Roseospira visakhapatnamensis]MBB4266511.1 heme-degrading monooxygenase HmoA [Roseospira visakhapatnamensis]
MIVRIDLLDTPDPGPVARVWSTALREAAPMPGFGGARLYRVYRRLNREGYALVSMARWDSLAAYHESDLASARPPFGAWTRPGIHLYAPVDASAANPRPVEDGHLIITNPYRIDRQSAGENARMWSATKTMMESREGFLDAELFQTFHPETDEYYFVSRARWETEAFFMKQFAGKDYKALVAPFEGTFQICFSHVEDAVTAGMPVAALRQPSPSIATEQVTS